MQDVCGSTLKILLVEDDPDIREIVSLAMNLDRSIRFATAPDGEAAITLLAQSSDFSLILVDVHLPDMSGTALANSIHRDYNVPVIFLTAAVRVADHERYLEAGALGVITKPFDPLSLANDIRRLLAGSGFSR